jgi:isocitrate/isopropylmalate dehydrogenase
VRALRIATIGGAGVGPEVLAATLSDPATHTPDLGGTATTTDLSTAVLADIKTPHLAFLPSFRR